MAEELLSIAKSVVLNSKFIVENVPDFWKSINGSGFVTAYKRLPPTSANVWCCMSNGNYKDPGLLFENIIESAQICAAHDSRIDESIAPTAFEVCFFVSQNLWLRLGTGVSASYKMQRSFQRAFLVQSKNNSRAVYLPDVWNEYKNWTSKQLLSHLATKAGSTFEEIDQVYEIPCFVVADPIIPVSIQDRGFFASLILQRAWNFYNSYKKGDQLAYLVTEDKISYDNEGACVRSLSDVQAYHQLAKILGHDSKGVVKFAQNEFECMDAAAIAAGIMLQHEIDEKLNIDQVQMLLLTNSTDFAFEKPQIVIALCVAYEFFNKREQLSLRQSIENFVADYFQATNLIENALKKHNAFAANWYLQAFATTKRTKWSCLSPKCEFFMKLMFHKRLFNDAIARCQDALQKKRSITEEACAAHGILVSKIPLDDDEICYNWALQQHEWNQKGGFRYYKNQAWYRLDVTSHVVQVCCLIRSGNRKELINN